MRAVLSILLLAFWATRAFAVGEWQIIKRDGRDYVTLENVGKFYQLGEVQQVRGSGFVLRTQYRSLRGQSGSKELYINNLKFILSYPIVETHGQLLVSRMDLTKLIEPVLRPGRITNASKVTTVVLDPGHGGHDHGARCVFGAEKNFTLDVALRTRALLRAAGFQVVMTRSSDVFIPLEERARIANRYQNAIFISIHFNSSSNNAGGLETYALAPRGVPSMAADGPKLSDFTPCPGNVRDTENIALACATHASMVYSSKMFDRGIKRARFVVIRDVTIPGVLVEGGFLSNSEDARRIASTGHRQQMAASLTQAVKNYRNAVGGVRPPLPVVSVDSNSKPAEPVVITGSSTQ